MVHLRHRKNEKPCAMDQRVRAVIAFMNTNLHRKLTPIEIAQSVCLSPSHLRHLFKTETDTPLAHYLKELRLQQAKRLLETTFLSVKEVAATVGISRVSHFVRDFKTAYRVTPARYAERYRNAEPKP
jgi:transcriptional regulator GlxA family with amidase domain